MAGRWMRRFPSWTNIWMTLDKNRVVKSYRLGEYGEGDAGVTIVEFKE